MLILGSTRAHTPTVNELSKRRIRCQNNTTNKKTVSKRAEVLTYHHQKHSFSLKGSEMSANLERTGLFSDTGEINTIAVGLLANLVLAFYIEAVAVRRKARQGRRGRRTVVCSAGKCLFIHEFRKIVCKLIIQSTVHRRSSTRFKMNPPVPSDENDQMRSVSL